MPSVCHLIPSMQSGGVEQVVQELCEGLQARGMRNTVISAGGGLVPHIEATGATHITRAMGRKNPKILAEVFWLRQYIINTRPDILHVHSRLPAWVAYLSCAMLPRAARPHIVSSFHGFYSVGGYSRIMTRSDHIIAVSACMKEHILENYSNTPEEKITVIPNSIDSHEYYSTFTPSEQWMREWREQHPELDGKMLLCLPGRITRLKGAEHLVPLLMELRRLHIPVHVLVVGECKQGKQAYYKELLELFDAWGLSEQVTWLGHRTDLRELLAISDVVLSLSMQPESFGKTTLEALALGRLVAGYNYGGVGELLSIFLPEGRIEPGDTTTMALRLAQWYKQPPAARQSVSSPFRREDMISAHDHLYRSLISS